jgi:UDP-N-acetylglucosamine--N-acetylmuramyl-(pentapeptide) pyrophosphoryl-undecaprenol N-acetylglucosamine transferase
VVSFIEDMPAEIGAADLVVSRSGASAVSEICSVGRPSLLVPYPYAAGDHQRKNAECLAEAGAAVWVANQDASPERLARELDELLAQEGRLAGMAERARTLGRPDAALVIAHDLLQLGRIAHQEAS